ncbi:hypothetical protein Tco_1090002, partial [Tanacetum coccineum]
YLSQAITYDMDDLVSKKIDPPKKRYCKDFSVDEMFEWTEMEVETEGVEGFRTSLTELTKDKEKHRWNHRDPFISVEKHVERYPMYDETTHWRLRKPKLGEKYISVAQFKECLTYYALENGFSLWHERSGEERVNGFSECFNSVIVNVRHKPLLTTLEAIRVIVLERMNKMREISKKWNPGVCPNIKKFWHVIPAGGKLFKVILLINRLPEIYVPSWFETDMYFVTSHNYVKLVSSMNFWPDQSMYSTVLLPKPRKMPRRFKKKTIRAIGEGGSSTRVSKVGSQGSCSNCKQPGHDKSSCKEPIVEQTPKPKGVVGRPRKKQPVDNFEDVDVVQRGPVRDEGASGTRGGAIGSRGRGGVAGSRGGASGSIGRGAGGSGSASGSRGRGTAGSRGGASGSIGLGQ